MPTFSEVTIVCVTDFVIGDTIVITTSSGTKPFEWVASRSGAGEVTTNTPTATAGEQSMIDLESAFDLDNPTGYVTTQSTNQLTIQSETEGEDFLGIIEATTNTGVIITTFNNYVPPFDITEVDLALTRSPFYVTTPFDFDTTTKATIDVRIWSGDRTTDKPVDPTISLTKIRPSIDYAEFNTDLSKLIRDRIEEVPVIGALASAAQIEVTPDTNIKWVEYIASYTDAVTQIADITGEFIASDGFGYYSEGVNPSNPTNQILSDCTYRKVSRDGLVTIPFVNDGTITDVDVVTDDVDLSTNFVVTASTDSEDYIQVLAIDVEQITNDTYITITFNTAVTSYVYTVEIVDECRYTPKQVVFKNKYGQFETMTLFKKSTETISTTNEEFTNNYISSGTYDATVHQFKKLNVEGTEKIRLSSGYLTESENELYKQLMLSDKVYFWVDDALIPVNLDNKSLEFKTRINDSLVNYEVEFSYAYNTINRI